MSIRAVLEGPEAEAGGGDDDERRTISLWREYATQAAAHRPPRFDTSWAGPACAILEEARDRCLHALHATDAAHTDPRRARLANLLLQIVHELNCIQRSSAD